MIDQLHRNGRLVPSSAVKTGMDGSFRLPPHQGPSVVTVVATARSHDAMDLFANVIADQRPPVIAPQEIELDGSGEYELVLQVKKPILVSGTVRWPDRSPAIGVELEAGVMAGSRGRKGDKVITDGNGEFTLKFPQDTKHAYVSCDGHRDEKELWHYADPDNEIEMGHKRPQSMSLTDLSKNLARVDWKLVPKKPAKISASMPTKTVSTKTKAAESEFAEISSRWYRTPAGEKDYQGLIKEFLVFEKKYRGESAAINALQQVISRTDRNGQPNGIQERAVELLKEFYLEHAELDSCLRNLGHGLPSTPIEEFFVLVAEKSPHERIKASALFSHTYYLSQQLELQSYLGRFDWDIKNMSDIPQEQRKHLQGLMKIVKRQDPDAIRTQIRKLASRLKKQFGQIVRQQFIGNINSFRFRPYQPADKSESKTFSEMADRFLFQIDALAIGKIIPDFDGIDVTGKKFKLSQFRGKVVLLMFSADWCGPCKQLYPANRELVKKFKEDPFQLISVMGDRKPETVAEAVEAGDINWLTTWDGDDGPIASKWNINSWPTLIVVDHKGVIRAKESVAKEREALIENLIKEAESDR